MQTGISGAGGAFLSWGRSIRKTGGRGSFFKRIEGLEQEGAEAVQQEFRVQEVLPELEQEYPQPVGEDRSQKGRRLEQEGEEMAATAGISTAVGASRVGAGVSRSRWERIIFKRVV